MKRGIACSLGLYAAFTERTLPVVRFLWYSIIWTKSNCCVGRTSHRRQLSIPPQILHLKSVAIFYGSQNYRVRRSDSPTMKMILQTSGNLRISTVGITKIKSINEKNFWATSEFRNAFLTQTSWMASRAESFKLRLQSRWVRLGCFSRVELLKPIQLARLSVSAGRLASEP